MAFFYKKRLLIAQKLLSETGVILISIDDNEQTILNILCDSIFREQNFLTMFVRKTKSMTDDDGNGLNIQHEYLLAYEKMKIVLLLLMNQKLLIITVIQTMILMAFGLEPIQVQRVVEKVHVSLLKIL